MKRMYVGKKVVVTGAGKGLGRTLAMAFAREGAEILVHYGHNEAGARSVVKEIQHLGGKAQALKADFSQVEALPQFVEDVRTRYPEIDVWVHNAGATANSSETRNLSELDLFHEIMAVDVRASWWLSRQIEPYISDGGCILTVGWDGALAGGRGLQSQLYAMSKGAVMAMTRCLAQEYAPRIRVNCLVPGFIENDWSATLSETTYKRFEHQIPMQRWGKPEDIAETALFLASEKASYITGQMFVVNGGNVMR